MIHAFRQVVPTFLGPDLVFQENSLLGDAGSENPVTLRIPLDCELRHRSQRQRVPLIVRPPLLLPMPGREVTKLGLPSTRCHPQELRF